MDQMHCYFLHSFDTGFKIKINELGIDTKIDDDSDDLESHRDELMIKLSSIIKSKRKNIDNIQRINKSKFVTNADEIYNDHNIEVFMSLYKYSTILTSVHQVIRLCFRCTLLHP